MVIFLYIIIAVVVGGAIILKWWYSSPKYKGKEGENRVHNILMQLPDDYVILDDIVLQTNRGTTQIDHIVVSKYGVFAIETKNYRGEIYGDDNRKEWTQMIITDVTYTKKWWKTYTYVTKNHFYNPVKQSLAHSIAIKSLLSEWSVLKVVPIIVFTGSAVLKDVTSNYHVVYDFNLLETILSFRTIYLSDNDVHRVVDILLHNNIREFVDDRSHVNNIYASKSEDKNKVALGICPQCGGNLVMRTGKYGTFYGCSNYPKCKFTTH
jgi:hypothetical protein